MKTDYTSVQSNFFTSEKAFGYLRKKYAVTKNCFYPTEDKKTEIVLHSAGQYQTQKEAVC